MKKLIAIILIATLFSSCATLLRKDTKQSVTFTTEPPNADVIIDGKKVGNSPVTVSIETTEEHKIEYKLKGYPTTSYSVEGEILPKYVVGDIAIGAGAFGWIPLLVDNHTNKWRGFDQWEIDSYSKLGDKLPVKDKDGDGIPDDMDACPSVKGLAKFKGCPDSDGDGIQDNEDVCPSTAGLTKFKGCPDTDGDGIKDSEDKCPTIAGIASNNGCPKKVEDKDGDGIIDSKDKCPTVAGIAANNGCPEIKEETKEVLVQAMEGLFFNSGSATVLPKSYSVLDNVAKIMNENPSYKLGINGYTDNTGKASYNLNLSQRRADAARNYLIKKGVDASRLTSTGYGIANPRADNNTPEGRKLNRRVEFKVAF